MDIIRDPSKTHRQTVFALAELADRLCDYPAGIPENFQRLADEEILCDHNDGHAPLCPRYILPDYERFMERGCDFLRLPAPRTLPAPAGRPGRMEVYPRKGDSFS